MPKKKNSKPIPVFAGMTLEQWRSDVSHLGWSQRDPIFMEILSVIQNESYVALAPVQGVTENRMLGRAEGYAMALEVFRSMAVKIEKPAPQIEPTYESESERNM